ncbi:MAG: hypothetical protein QXF12_04710 [Candidatus Aenigmatarchaeota archaeon]
MSTTGHHNKEYTTEQLMSAITGTRDIQITATFGQSEGQLHEFTVQGRFFYKGFNSNGPNLYDYLRETEVPEVLIAHYSSIWDYLSYVMNLNYDFTQNEEVTFTIRNNPKMSVNYHKGIIKYTEEQNQDGVFTTDIYKRVFYDLVISADGEDIIKIAGIPHFGIPAVMKYLGKWLQLVDDTVAVVA